MLETTVYSNQIPEEYCSALASALRCGDPNGCHCPVARNIQNSGGRVGDLCRSPQLLVETEK